MKKIVGIPVIGIILKRLKKTKEADKVIVATSKNKENIPSKEKDIPIYIIQIFNN